ncbi:GGDEF domain-containing protein [Brevibacillus sp. SYSU BS000544]|uniref:GGDEF domain-containing protein n=1 Tax=Brevibacillus sp. SYSU BS000544 TaxID=3416443 RepID=UPI003CE568D1
MDLLLDMKTIFITLVVGHLFTVILISAYWRHHQKDTTINTFFIAKCVQAIAWFFLTLRNGIPDVLTISIANSLLFIGASLEIIAVLMLQHAFTVRLKKVYILLTICNIVGFHLILFFYNFESVRIAFASVGVAVLVIIPAWRMVREKTASMLMKIIGYLYLFVIVSLFGRAVVALFLNQSMGLFTPGIYQTLSFLALYLVMMQGNTGFVLLLKEQVDQELLRLASYDDLTGTLNRRTFIFRAKQCIRENARKQKPVTLLLFDVDYFKKINDTYGHDIGDRVLQSLSEKIIHHLGTENLFGRYGGDEFAILLPGIDEIEATECAEQIRQLAGSLHVQGISVPYTLSLGILTVVPDQQTQLESLYISCDKALYGAKKNGRNCVYQVPAESAKIVF